LKKNNKESSIKNMALLRFIGVLIFAVIFYKLSIHFSDVNFHLLSAIAIALCIVFSAFALFMGYLWVQIIRHFTNKSG